METWLSARAFSPILLLRNAGAAASFQRHDYQPAVYWLASGVCIAGVA